VHASASNIILLSRDTVARYVKDYYFKCYGIRVIDNMEIRKFFKKINDSMPEAKSCASTAFDSINAVLYKGKKFNDEYIKKSGSFYGIISSIGAIGASVTDKKVVELLGKVIQKKFDLSGAYGAWSQYTHLAEWLIYLGSILEIEPTSIKDIYLDAVLFSMNKMTNNTNRMGHSWATYIAWSLDWLTITHSNRNIIRKHIEANTDWPDALKVVKIV